MHTHVQAFVGLVLARAGTDRDCFRFYPIPIVLDVNKPSSGLDFLEVPFEELHFNFVYLGLSANEGRFDCLLLYAVVHVLDFYTGCLLVKVREVGREKLFISFV